MWQNVRNVRKDDWLLQNKHYNQDFKVTVLIIEGLETSSLA